MSGHSGTDPPFAVSELRRRTAAGGSGNWAARFALAALAPKLSDIFPQVQHRLGGTGGNKDGGSCANENTTTAARRALRLRTHGMFVVQQFLRRLHVGGARVEIGPGILPRRHRVTASGADSLLLCAEQCRQSNELSILRR